MNNLRKIELMHKMFGCCEGHVCGECDNLARVRANDKLLRKCSVYGLTHSEASDWTLRFTACGMFNTHYDGLPIIEFSRHNSAAPELPLKNQVTMDLEALDGKIC